MLLSDAYKKVETRNVSRHRFLYAPAGQSAVPAPIITRPPKEFAGLATFSLMPREFA